MVDKTEQMGDRLRRVVRSSADEENCVVSTDRSHNALEHRPVDCGGQQLSRTGGCPQDHLITHAIAGHQEFLTPPFELRDRGLLGSSKTTVAW